MRALVRPTVIVTLAIVGMFGVADATADDPQTRQLLTVPNEAWASLDQGQRDLVSARYAVEVAEKGRFARIINIQGVNESTPGTTGGAAIGSAVGQAQYLDKTNWRNYSATNQLAFGILGALIGAALDAPPRASFRHVYTVRSADGSVRVIEKITQSPIYVAPGLCVDTNSFTPAQDDFCEDGWPQEIRVVLGSPLTAPPAAIVSTPTALIPVTPAPALPMRPATAISRDDIVFCRLGSTSTAQTTAEKCLQAGGTIQP